ncbi:hypothetical protein F8388_013157 [Cannabis sativa]|uniref:Thioredoxin domain-containing protein n=1 Tax=Cannabis sativa TaxID=3483 RepID=A0A7J6HMV0_CANSA|nr:hypothetical protein F8388_013157 [Cannabis sativa]
MISPGKLKSVDFYRKIPRDLTEASLSGAGLSIIAALSMVFLLEWYELNNYLTISTSTSVIVDKSTDGDYLRIDFDISFPTLSCEFASVDVSDILGTNRLNITKTIRKFSIDADLKPTGAEFHSEPMSNFIKHGDEVDEEAGEGSVALTANNFDKFSHQYPVLIVNFFAPWCYWSNRLKNLLGRRQPGQYEEKYDPELDGRIIMGRCFLSAIPSFRARLVGRSYCIKHHIQGYPSIRIFRKGSDLRLDHGHHDHESYYGDRDADSLVKMMEGLVAPIELESQKQLPGGSNTTENAKRPAPKAGGCRIEGYVRVKKVPGNLIISARSGSHSFDASQMNMSHIVSHLSFGKKITPKVMSDVKRLIPYLGGSHDRLNGRKFINQRDIGANVTIEHYLQVVKTEVITRGSHKLVEEYEYTAHSSVAQSVYIPTAKFHFELSPMQVLITENPKSFSHFITNVCAIIGGVFTVAGILDSILHNTFRIIKKVELGKNF